MNNNSPILISFIVPCLNEAPRIEGALENIREACRQNNIENFEILVVDDGSTDDTPEVVERYINEKDVADVVRLIRQEQNRGLGRTYLDNAFLARGQYYRMYCGDAAEPSEALADALGHLGEADIILSVHNTVPGRPLGRTVLSKTFTFLVNTISGHKITYYNGSPILLRYDVMRWAPNSFGFGFQADLVTRLLDEGRTYREVFVHVTHVVKDSEYSALQVRNFLSVGHTLLEISIRRFRQILYPTPPELSSIKPLRNAPYFLEENATTES